MQDSYKNGLEKSINLTNHEHKQMNTEDVKKRHWKYWIQNNYI